MSTKFTPGEWRVCELTRRYGVYDSSGTSIAKIDGAYGVAMERRKADAHLIAAAPEIGALLAQAVRLYETYGLVAESPECGKWVNDSRDALKKAGV